jgi:hypothetical protein
MDDSSGKLSSESVGERRGEWEKDMKRGEDVGVGEE